MMPAFVRGMVVLGLLALIAAMVVMWRSEDTGLTPQPMSPIGSGRPVGTSTLSHGGPAPVANQADSRDSGSER
jgi:hypothetical protein